MKRILIFCVVMATMGCARWTQEGKSYIETKQDAAGCADSILAEHRDLNPETVKTCMEAKGYRRSTAERVETGSVPPPAETESVPPPAETESVPPPAEAPIPNTDAAP